MKGRPRAVFLCLVLIYLGSMGLAGCSTSSSNPIVATVAGFIPGREDVSARAEQIPYASIDLVIGGRGGLLVLSSISQGLTFWQTSRLENVVFRDGYLDSTSGIEPALQMTRIDDNEGGETATPWSQAVNGVVEYTVTRSWTNKEGEIETGRARARLSCKPDGVEKKLPLTTRTLQECVEALSWASGKQTTSVMWREPEDHHVWAADVVAWPGSPLYSWKVARPWW